MLILVLNFVLSIAMQAVADTNSDLKADANSCPKLDGDFHCPATDNFRGNWTIRQRNELGLTFFEFYQPERNFMALYLVTDQVMLKSKTNDQVVLASNFCDAGDFVMREDWYQLKGDKLGDKFQTTERRLRLDEKGNLIFKNRLWYSLPSGAGEDSYDYRCETGGVTSL